MIGNGNLRYSIDKMDKKRERFKNDFWISGLNMGITLTELIVTISLILAMARTNTVTTPKLQLDLRAVSEYTLVSFTKSPFLDREQFRRV